MTATVVVFPNYVATLTGVAAVYIGARSVKIQSADSTTVHVPRKLFTEAEIADQGNGLAWRARQIADGYTAATVE